MSTATSERAPRDARPFAALASLWLAGLYLRLPVLAAPPLATDIAADLGLGRAGVGALTTIPLVTIAFGAVPAAWLMRRIGVSRALVAGVIAMALMSASRGLADGALVLFGATFAMGLGISIMQTALPSVVGLWTPRHLAFGTAVYMNGMMIGEFAGAALTLPVIMPLAGGSWRLGLLLWSVPVALVAVLLARTRPRRTAADVAEETRTADDDGTAERSLWRDRATWRLGTALGASVVVFYAINAYMGSVLAERGESASLAGLLFAFNVAPFVASLVSLAFGTRWSGRTAPLVASGSVAALGLLGFVVLPGPAGQVSAVVAGFAATLELILLVSLPPVLVRASSIGALTAAMTTIGYGIAFVLPLAGGLLADATNAGAGVTLGPSVGFAILGVLPLFGIASMAGGGARR